MFFSGGKNENRMGRRLLQGFEKCIECIGAEHVDLIDDVYLVFSSLWRKTDLFNQVADIIHRIVAGSIEFMYIERASIVEGLTGIAGIAGLAILPQIFTVDGFGQDPGTGCFAHAPWPAEQKCMRKMLLKDRIFQGSGDMGLSHYG
jgi:hypothetical protein